VKPMVLNYENLAAKKKEEFAREIFYEIWPRDFYKPASKMESTTELLKDDNNVEHSYKY